MLTGFWHRFRCLGYENQRELEHLTATKDVQFTPNGNHPFLDFTSLYHYLGMGYLYT